MASVTGETVLFHGPPFIGKTLHYFQRLSESHQRVSPSDLFQENPELTLRQVINQEIIVPLKKGQNVAVDDSCQTRATRASYKTLIQKKVPGARIICLHFRPQFATEQLLWYREYTLAAAVGTEQTDTSLTSQDNIEKWLDRQEEPQEDEGLEVSVIESTLHCQSNYKFEVPGLFIQWEGLVKGSDDGHLNVAEGAQQALQLWADCNPCGRIIIIMDGCLTHGVSQCETDKHIRCVLQELANQMTVPVYLLHINETWTSGRFSLPPNPGLLAFLQRLHLLDLHLRVTLYLYHTASHMKMAVRAGVRHVHASRVFSHPKLVKTLHGTTRPEVPSLLKSCTVVSPCGANRSNRRPTIPLYESTVEANPCLSSCRLTCGRTLYLCAKNRAKLEEYQRLYEDCACAVDSAEASRIPAVSRQLTVVSTLPVLAATVDDTSLVIRNRELPEWMTNKRKTNKKTLLMPHDSSTLETDVEPKRERKRSLKSLGSSTVYLMSERELLETAKLILTEAGETVTAGELTESLVTTLGQSDDVHSTHADAVCESLATSIPTTRRHSDEVNKTKGKNVDMDDTSFINNTQEDFMDDLLFGTDKQPSKRNVKTSTDSSSGQAPTKRLLVDIGDKCSEYTAQDRAPRDKVHGKLILPEKHVTGRDIEESMDIDDVMLSHQSNVRTVAKVTTPVQKAGLCGLSDSSSDSDIAAILDDLI